MIYKTTRAKLLFLSLAFAFPSPVIATENDAQAENVNDPVSEEFLLFLLEFRDEKGQWVDPSALAVMDHPSIKMVEKNKPNQDNNSAIQANDDRNTLKKDDESTREHLKENTP